jgi:hypothetical protein
MRSLQEQLREYIAAAFPGIWITSFEHDSGFDASRYINAPPYVIQQHQEQMVQRDRERKAIVDLLNVRYP